MAYRSNVKPEIIKLLEEHIQENLFDLGLGKDFNFLHMTTKAQSTKEKLDKLNCIKMKTFCSSETH